MHVEGTQGRGSMFGAVDSLQNMTRAFEALLEFLPDGFVWPTSFDVSPFMVYASWGRTETEIRDRTNENAESLWLVANPEGVKMNANFRPDWPQCGAADFDAETAAGWLKDLTKNWEWSAEQSGEQHSSSLSRGSMHTPR